MSTTKAKKKHSRKVIVRTPKGFRRLKLNEKRCKGDFFFFAANDEWIGHWPLAWGIPVLRGDYPVIRKIKINTNKKK